MKQYLHVYEELDGDKLVLEALFDSGGEIGSLFVYSPLVDSMVAIDITAFQHKYPNKFNDIQEQVFLQLREIYDEGA